MMENKPYVNKRERWQEIGVPKGWKVDGPSGEYISKGRKKVWADFEEGTFSISDGFWLPGIYADVETAIRAISAPDDLISDLSKRICHFDQGNREITAEDLTEALNAEKRPMTTMGHGANDTSRD